MINIFNSERPTNCWAREELASQCPRYGGRKQAEVLGEALSAFQEGIRSAKPRAEFMAWTYMDGPKTNSLTTLPIAPMLRVMRKSDPGIIWLGNFEHGYTKELCGRAMELHE